MSALQPDRLVRNWQLLQISTIGSRAKTKDQICFGQAKTSPHQTAKKCRNSEHACVNRRRHLKSRNFVNMKRTITILALSVCVCSLGAFAQSGTDKMSIGFHVSQYQRDFGIGLHFVSPYFLNSKIAVKVAGNLQWLEHYDGTETTWSPYCNFQFGIRARQFIIEDKLFIYGEGGTVILISNSDFSSERHTIGGYGLFGFEFKPSASFGYFIELGGMGTGARADKVAARPIYSNGFLTNVGFRIGLGKS
jgi:hypothetical protein